ncbi:MAG: carbohydrate-binding protein [Maribacter sp.]
MRNIKYSNVGIILLLSLVIVFVSSCERDFSDDVEFATFPPNGDVFLDNFSAGLDYFPFVGAGADPEAFSVETEEVFQGVASMRFDVPAFGNGFVGANFGTTARRDLSGFDALTFYAKASQAADINEIGFGIDGETGNKFQVTTQNVQVSTRWQKYIIPIPDASKLVDETGLFWLAEGAENENDEGGYVLWFDEIKFEKLGTIAQSRPAILGGVDVAQQGFLEVPITLSGLTQTFNVGSDGDVTVLVQPSYFDFESTDNGIASVNELGVVSVTGTGDATITASLANVAASGSLQLNVIGGFDFAPVPPSRNPEDVISIFSDSYNNRNIDFFNGFFGGSTTLGGAIPVAEESVIRYTNLNFVAVQFANPTLDVSQMTHIHIDIKIDEALDSGDALTIELGDFGADGVFGGVGSDDSAGSATPLSSELKSGEWVGIDIPISSFSGGTGGGFTGLTSSSNLAQVSFVSGNISDISVDNIYFYRE